MKAFDATRHYFDRAADQMDLTDNMRRLLLTPKREVTSSPRLQQGCERIVTFRLRCCARQVRQIDSEPSFALDS